MKHLILALALLASPAMADTTSGASVDSNIALTSHSENNFASGYQSSTIKTTGQATAPSFGGGSHPCLAGKSGGLGIIGGAASYGSTGPESVCMLAFLGQPQAALILLAEKDPQACRVLVSMGSLNSTCGGTIKQAAANPSIATIATCSKVNGKRRVTLKAGNKARAQEAVDYCKGRY
jgi:hypothetical protein